VFFKTTETSTLATLVL